MDWTVEKTKYKNVRKERRKNSKPKQEQGKLKPKMVPTVGNEKNQWVKKLREGLTRLPLMAAEFLERFSFSWASPLPLLHRPLFLLFTQHCTWNRASPCQGMEKWQQGTLGPHGPWQPHGINQTERAWSLLPTLLSFDRGVSSGQDSSPIP